MKDPLYHDGGAGDRDDQENRSTGLVIRLRWLKLATALLALALIGAIWITWRWG